MTIKKNLENEMDTRWRTKGSPHRCAIPLPEVCPDCGGKGYTQDVSKLCISDPHPCKTCEGTGEVYK